MIMFFSLAKYCTRCLSLFFFVYYFDRNIVNKYSMYLYIFFNFTQKKISQCTAAIYFIISLKIRWNESMSRRIDECVSTTTLNNTYNPHLIIIIVMQSVIVITIRLRKCEQYPQRIHGFLKMSTKLSKYELTFQVVIYTTPSFPQLHIILRFTFRYSHLLTSSM